MTNTDFQSCLKHHWSFRLFNSFPKLHYFFISIGISSLIYILGIAIFALLGGLKDYLVSFLPYMFLIGFSLIVSSYGWWMASIVRMLSTISPAFEISPAKFKKLVITWDQTWLNGFRAVIIFALPFAILNAKDVINLWTFGIPPELQSNFARQAWGVWISSSKAEFFAVWYGLLHIVLTSLALGSGIAGVIATIHLIRLIGKQKLKLAYYRTLDAPVSLASNLAFWVFIALIAISIFSRPTILSLANNYQQISNGFLLKESFELIVSTIVQAVLALFTLIAIFGLPFYFCHTAIKNAKSAYSANLLQVAEELYIKIKNISGVAAAKENNKILKTEHLEEIKNQLSVINSLLLEIDRIPTWPLSLGSGIQISSGFVLSIVSPVLTNWLANVLLM